MSRQLVKALKQQRERIDGRSARENPPAPGTYLATWRDDKRKSDPPEHKWHTEGPTYWNGETWERPAELNRHWVVVGWKTIDE